MEVESQAGRNDPVLDRSGARFYTREMIEKLEERHVPWLRQRRRRR
jgi:hypothetical protein